MFATENTQTKVTANEAFATTKNSVHSTNEVARNTFSTSWGLWTNNKLAGGDWGSLRGHVLMSIFNFNSFDFGLQGLLLGQLQILPKLDRTTRSHKGEFNNRLRRSRSFEE